jgi:hypothetical protein
VSHVKTLLEMGFKKTLLFKQGSKGYFGGYEKMGKEIGEGIQNCADYYLK